MHVLFMDKNGIKLAFLDYTYGTNNSKIPENRPFCIDTLNNESHITAELKYAEEKADATIVFVHWGDEYTTKLNEQQTKWTDIFFQNGVDAVIGSHPHVLQRYEKKSGNLPDGSPHEMLIYYSLGNFVSGQNEIPRILGGMASFTITMSKERGITIDDYDLEPVITHQEAHGIYTAYMLRDYTDDLAQRHRLDFSISQLWVMFDKSK
jgi:poly-gamma-glutamate capsule biosynthesis protein CapA/YwtB (metallophosphatase superfamily)